MCRPLSNLGADHTTPATGNPLVLASMRRCARLLLLELAVHRHTGSIPPCTLPKTAMATGCDDNVLAVIIYSCDNLFM